MEQETEKAIADFHDALRDLKDKVNDIVKFYEKQCMEMAREIENLKNR